MKTALLLPGQGSQYVGMGRDLADAYPEVADLWLAAEELLSVPLRRFCWEGPEEELRATQNAQPAILLHSYAVWRLIAPRLAGSIAVGAGHSLGEFSAHLLADTLSLEDALRLVRVRGELMARSDDARPGTMAAVLGLDPEQILRICGSVADGVVVPANYNAPGQVVISGDVEAVERASRAAEEGGARVMPLPVSGAFHSSLMDSASGGLAEALDRVAWADPRFPIVANATAAAVVDAETVRGTLLRQLTAPVRWVEGLAAMREMGPDRWLEIGPGRVLAGLARRIDRSIAVRSIGDLKSVEELLMDEKGEA